MCLFGSTYRSLHEAVGKAIRHPQQLTIPLFPNTKRCSKQETQKSRSSFFCSVITHHFSQFDINFLLFQLYRLISFFWWNNKQTQVCLCVRVCASVLPFLKCFLEKIAFPSRVQQEVCNVDLISYHYYDQYNHNQSVPKSISQQGHGIIIFTSMKKGQKSRNNIIRHKSIYDESRFCNNSPIVNYVMPLKNSQNRLLHII